MGNREQQQLLDRARRRWLLMMGATLLVVCVGTPFLNWALGTDHGHRHNGVAGVLVSVVPALVVAAVVLLWLARRSHKPDGMYAPRPINGLDRAGRRQVQRAIRLARPSSDPTLAEVESDTARRTVNGSAPNRVIFGFALVGTAALAIGDHHLAARIFFGAGTVMFVGMLIAQVRQVAQSRRYLAAAQTPAG